MKQKIEIMAPAGSYAALDAAIRAGADSIYFGAGVLNMRSQSSANFQMDDIRKIAKKCRKCGVKSYLVLNVLVYDEDLDAVRETCKVAKEAGVSAVIATDIAAIEYAHSIGLEVHISTQQNISNVEAVRFFSRYATVMVLARELQLHQIKNIIDRIREENITGPDGKLVRIELFAHGAMCMAISGKCYLSLTKYNRSANRGACVQQCRREYTVKDTQTGEELILDNGFVMSPKDMCIVEFLQEILDSGVSILKIEGRGRTPEYVHTVVRVYREAADAWYEGTYSKEMFDGWLERLSAVFNRGFWRGGYYLGEEFGEWTETDGSQGTKRKIYIGIASNYFARLGVGEFKMMAGELSVGQEILVTGETTGAVNFTVKELRVDGKPVEVAKKGDVVSLPVPVKIRRRNKVYLMLPRTFGDGHLGGEVVKDSTQDLNEECGGCSCS